jgi:GT2 family glycosyltransferase
MSVIDVVVPVYKGLPQTRRCVDSVLANAQRAAFEVVVIDDASPDPGIAAWLDELGGQGRITLVRNATNLGFVQSVNRGMSLHADRDVVLLNSDTEVANDWLDRLCRSVYGQTGVGTATPFSNNATICSYPFEGWAGGVPGTLGLAALDRLFATVNAGRAVELPTGVGFCMYIRRACLDQVGLFDAGRFGRGYGEENDFCMRAAGAGWSNILAGDVFVFHEGAVSFSGERAALTEFAGKALVDLHPDYVRRVREFVMRDPTAPLRAAVDRARVAHGAAELAQVLSERIDEVAVLKARLVEAELKADEEGAKLRSEIAKLCTAIGSLREGLALAEQLVVERDGEIARLNAEIGNLRAGLSHAEALAFARASEIAELHRSWLWKARRFLLRLKTRESPQRPA